MLEDIYTAIRTDRGNRLKAIREQKRMTAQGLVEAISKLTEGKTKYSSGAVYAWEKGRNLIGVDVAILLSAVLQCSMQDILGSLKSEVPSPLEEQVQALAEKASDQLQKIQRQFVDEYRKKEEECLQHLSTVSLQIVGPGQLVSHNLNTACRWDIFYHRGKKSIIAISSNAVYKGSLSLLVSCPIQQDNSCWYKLEGKKDTEFPHVYHFDIPEQLRAHPVFILCPSITASPILLAPADIAHDS